jgi:hypothetical protein
MPCTYASKLPEEVVARSAGAAWGKHDGAEKADTCAGRVVTAAIAICALPCSTRYKQLSECRGLYGPRGYTLHLTLSALSTLYT